MMRKTRSTIYFQKRYCLLLHSLNLNQQLSIDVLSQNHTEFSKISRKSTTNLNQIIYINCVDIIENGITISDSQPIVHFRSLEKDSKKSDIASISFDMSKQRIVKPESQSLFAKELNNKKGTLQYKFINLKTRGITYEQFQSYKKMRDQLQIELQKDEKQFKIDQLLILVNKKDEIIKNLQIQIHEIMVKQKKRNLMENRQSSSSKEKIINLNVKVDNINDKFAKEKKEFRKTIMELHDKTSQLDLHIQILQKQNEALHGEIALLKKQKQSIENLYLPEQKLRKKSMSLSNNLQPNIPMNNSQDNKDNLTPKYNIIESKLKQSFADFQKEAKFIDPAENVEQKRLDSRASIQNSNYLSNVNSKAIKNRVGNAETPTFIKTNTQQRDQTLERRIILQLQDLKRNSIVMEKTEELALYKKKLQLKNSQIMSIQKELQKCKLQLKKKQLEIKDIRKQSKKNLIYNANQTDASKLNIQLQIQKMQMDHQNEKMALENQLQSANKQVQQNKKQLRRLKLSLQELSSSQNNAQAKYSQLRKLTAKKEEQFIEYRQKSQQYNILIVQSKEMEQKLKKYQSHCLQLQSQNQKLTQQINKNIGRIKQLEKDISKFKNLQRQYDYTKNKNVNMAKTIESYEGRYQQLKKYCIKMQSVYSKFINSRKKNANDMKFSFEDMKEDRHIQEQFNELNKKLISCQQNYYNKQIEDYIQEKQIISSYYQSKINQQKQKIILNMEMNEEEKMDNLMKKQKEVLKIMHQKLAQITDKKNNLEKIRDQNTQKTHQQTSTFILDIPQKIKHIQKRIGMIIERQEVRAVQRKNIKQTLSLMSESVNQKSNHKSASSLLAIQNANKSSSRNLMLASMVNQGKLKNSILQEVRMRTQSTQQKAYQQNRKMNTDLLKQNGELKIKIQKVSMDLERQQRNFQERQKQLQQTFKKQDTKNKVEKESLKQDLQKSAALVRQLQQKLKQRQQNIDQLEVQLINVSKQNQDQSKMIYDLEKQTKVLSQTINQYQQAQRMLIDQVRRIKTDAENNKQQLYVLLQQRSDDFARIQKLKEQQCEKLKSVIRELQIKLEAEMHETIKSHEKIQIMKQQIEKLQKQLIEKLQMERTRFQTKQLENEELYKKQIMLSKQSQNLQTSLLQISSEIQGKQIQIASLNYEINSLNKQIQVYKTQSKNYENESSKLHDNISHLQDISNSKSQQLKKFQQAYLNIQHEMKSMSFDIQRLSHQNERLSISLFSYQNKYDQKQQELLKIKEMIGVKELQLKRQQMMSDMKQKQLQSYKNKVLQLQINNKKLRQQLQSMANMNNNTNLPSPTQNNYNLNISRNIKNIQNSIIQPSSPGKKVKRADTMGNSIRLSNIGLGGITPIVSNERHVMASEMQDPFEPQQLNKSSLFKKQSLKGQQIKINVEEPSKNVNKANIHDETSRINFDIAEESLTLNQKQSQEKFMQLVQVQNQKEVQQNIFNGGDKKNIQSQNIYQRNMVLDNSIQFQQHQENQLQQQLVMATEQNQKLHNEIQQLHTQIDELKNKLKNISSQQPINNISPTSSIRKSKKQQTNNQHNKTQMKYGNEEEEMINLKSISRAQSNQNFGKNKNDEIIMSRNVNDYKQQLQSAQIQIQALKNQLTDVKNQLKQHTSANQLLCQQLQLDKETIQELSNRLEEANFIIEQNKKFIQFQEMYKTQQNISNELRYEIEQLNSEIFSKETMIQSLIDESKRLGVELQQLKNENALGINDKDNLESKIKDLNLMIKKMKIQYRKYEEQSQLQIVKLKDMYEDLKVSYHKKEQEVVFLGQQHLKLQDEKSLLLKKIDAQTNIITQISQRDIENEDILIKLDRERQKVEEVRQGLQKKIKELQIQLSNKEQMMKNIAKDSNLLVKKYEIKIQGLRQQIMMNTNKLTQKQQTVNVLKNQIALYNQQSQALKKSNQEMIYQQTKIETYLKQIMGMYENEIDMLKKNSKSFEHNSNKTNENLQQKQRQYSAVVKQLRIIQKQRDQLKCDYVQLKNICDKLKLSTNKEFEDLNVKYQHKINQYEIIKAEMQKYKRQLMNKQEQFNVQIQKQKIRQGNYKENLSKYEALIDQFQKQYQQLSRRPTIQYFEQIKFENQILRNKVNELQEQIMIKNTESAKKEDAVYSQFKKYKTNKQSQMMDLRGEMETYGRKISDFEESIFSLKQENEELRRTIQFLQRNNDEIHQQRNDLRFTIEQMQKQIQFYKKRKIINMKTFTESD